MVKLANVNTTSLRDAIELGCRTMCSVFNKDDNNIPFFSSEVIPNAHLGFSPFHSEAHVPGRHLNALLTAQDELGLFIDESCIEKHTAALFFSYSGIIPFPLNRESIDGPLNRLIVHNIREGFHGLYALVKYRRHSLAQEIAEKSISAILEYWNPDKGWDTVRLENMGLEVQAGNFILGIGRVIGPLVKYYKTTNYDPALELLLSLKEVAIEEYFKQNGSFNLELFGKHIHSVTSTLSSLAQLADLLQDMQLIERVKAFYDNGMWRLRDELGWVIEVDDPERNPDRGEINSTGDLVETAILLGKWGYTKYYQDAERMLRGHLLPSQLRDISFISEPDNPENKDGLNNVANRHLGAFGFPAPYGHEPIGIERICFNMDIVGGAVASLCEAYSNAVTYENNTHRINMLFDHESSNISVKSEYKNGFLKIIIKRSGDLFIRIPTWVDKKCITVEGANIEGFIDGHYFLIKPKVNQPFILRFPLTEKEIVLHHRTRDIRVKLLGDSVLAMDNFGANYTFFDSIY